MKLHYYINKEGKKVYTLKETIDNEKKEQTKDAHYKFIKFDKSSV